MSRFRYYLEAISEKSQERLKALGQWNTEIKQKATELEEKIKGVKSGHKFMEAIKDEWTKGWTNPEGRSEDFQKLTREFEQTGNTYRITLWTPASSDTEEERYSHTVDKNPGIKNEKENTKDAKRRHLLLKGLIAALIELQKSKDPTWIQSFKYDSDTLIIKLKYNNDYDVIINADNSNNNVYKDIDSMGGIIAFNPNIYKNIKIKELINKFINSGEITKDKFYQMSEEDFKDNLPNDKENWEGFGWSTK